LKSVIPNAWHSWGSTANLQLRTSANPSLAYKLLKTSLSPVYRSLKLNYPIHYSRMSLRRSARLGSIPTVKTPLLQSSAPSQVTRVQRSAVTKPRKAPTKSNKSDKRPAKSKPKSGTSYWSPEPAVTEKQETDIQPSTTNPTIFTSDTTPTGPPRRSAPNKCNFDHPSRHNRKCLPSTP